MVEGVNIFAPGIVCALARSLQRVDLGTSKDKAYRFKSEECF